MNHTYENGRRYHGFRSDFPFPDDLEEQKRQGFHSDLWYKVLDNKLFTTPPLKNNDKVLDVGTGSGKWIVDMCFDYPDVRLLGIDPCYMQLHGMNGLNLIRDLEGSEWPFTQKQALHLIHAQGLAGRISDWKGLYQNAYKHLLPGGWMEVKEHDMKFYSNSESNDWTQEVPDLIRWVELLKEAGTKFPKRLNVAGQGLLM
jgi:trans-aconitate methyltransferase